MEAPKKIGRYEILRELGRGAMGTVYQANDPAMNRVVAIKTITSLALASEHGAEFRKHFYREARAAGALLHPGIVAVFDVGEHEGTPFLVMEFIDGKTLAQTMEAGERLSLESICEIGQQIAEALGYAHQHGVVHRDIKPDNILLASGDVQHGVRPKISDFGVAKLAEIHTTLSGEIRGTPAFMSPEEFNGTPIDGRSDIFSLGVVLYWIATGEQPFPGKNMTAVFYKIVHTEPVPPRKLNPSVPAKLDAAILRCLEKDPANRYASGEELARDLGEVRAAIGARTPGNTLAAPSVAWPHAAPAEIDSRHHTSFAWANKVSAVWILATVVAVMAAAAGGYFLRSPGKSNAQKSAAPLLANSPVKPGPDAPLHKQILASAATAPVAKGVPASPREKPRVAPKRVQAKTPAPTGPVVTASRSGTARESAAAAVGFDPKTLDPKQNAKLRIDTQQMPAGLPFVVEMNGKLYLRETPRADASEQDLFVPPGVQEFQVVAKSGAVEKTSNIVSADFKAKKRSTLKIELRTQGMLSEGVPQGLYPDSQIVLTLK